MMRDGVPLLVRVVLGEGAFEAVVPLNSGYLKYRELGTRLALARPGGNQSWNGDPDLEARKPLDRFCQNEYCPLHQEPRPSSGDYPDSIARSHGFDDGYIFEETLLDQMAVTQSSR